MSDNLFLFKAVKLLSGGMAVHSARALVMGIFEESRSKGGGLFLGLNNKGGRGGDVILADECFVSLLVAEIFF